MTLGESGGRSRSHPTGAGAARRATPRERAEVDPPFEPVPLTKLETVQSWNWDLIFSWVALGCGLVACIVAAIAISGWFGLI